MRPLVYVIAGVAVMGLGYTVLAQQNWLSRLHPQDDLPALAAEALPRTLPVGLMTAAGSEGAGIDATMTAQVGEGTEIAQASPAQTVPAMPSTTAQAPVAQAPATAPTTTPPAAAASQPIPVDETALRYFARQGDTQRVETEIERLKSLHPGWEPPANLLSDDYVPDPDILAIWQLFTAGDYAGARAAIAAKQQKDPSYVPSADLLASLDLEEASARLRNASDAKQYQAVINVAANAPNLLTCERIDNLWRLAEAFVQTGAKQRGIDAYSYILSNCTDTAERYATMQKAVDLLDRADLDPLFALERKDDAGQDEFAGLRLDLARRAISAFLEPNGARPEQADVTLLEQSANQTNAPDDLRLLGWYQLGVDRPNQARTWFEKAMTQDPSADSAQGLGVTLLRLRDAEEAEAVLADYRDANDTLTGLYLDAAAALLATDPRIQLSADVLGRIADMITSQRNGAGAQEMGWYAYGYDQPQTAIEWFSMALRWQPDLEPAAYGLLVAANAVGDSATVAQIQANWGTRSQRIADFGRTSATQTSAPPVPQARPAAVRQATQATPAAPAQAAPAQAPAATSVASAGTGGSGGGSRGCTNEMPPGALSAGAALSYAWCLMDLNRPAQAVDHFERALQSADRNTRSDAAYGQALAYIRLDLSQEAAVAAAKAPLTNQRVAEIEIAILSKQATNAYAVGDYRKTLNALDARAQLAPERNDLLTLRAWSYYHLGRYNEAKQIFTAVAATGYGDAVAGLEATNGRIQQNEAR